MESNLQEIEAELQKLSPHGMPEDVISRLDEAMSRWHESVPVEEKVVPLSDPQASPKESWFQWRAVAAVACFGIAAAIYFTNTRREKNLEVGARSGMNEATPVTFRPLETSAQVVGVQDQGYLTSPNGHTLRAVGIKVSNQVHFQNAKGHRATIEKPTFDLIFVPFDVD